MPEDRPSGNGRGKRRGVRISLTQPLGLFADKSTLGAVGQETLDQNLSTLKKGCLSLHLNLKVGFLCMQLRQKRKESRGRLQRRWNENIWGLSGDGIPNVLNFS